MSEDVWIASSLIRVRIEDVSFNPPSAVCTIEIPSLALRSACFKDRMFAFIFSEIASPAASSAAFVIRVPDDNFAKLLSEIQKEYPVILEEMRNLHTTYLDIWDISDKPDSAVDRRCRLGYSQFLAELTALGVLDSDMMKRTLETLKECIADCLSEKCHMETVEEYMDCLRQLCGSKVPKDVRVMIREMLLSDLDKWISETKISAPGLSTKSRFACMDLKDHLMR